MYKFSEGLMTSEKGLPPSNDEMDDEEGRRKPLNLGHACTHSQNKDTQLGLNIEGGRKGPC